MLDMGFEPQIREIVQKRVREPQGERPRQMSRAATEVRESLRQMNTVDE